MPQPNETPKFTFTVSPSAAPFSITPGAYLAAQPDQEHNVLATGALVFDDATSPRSQPRILLLQRAAGDSLPGRWEVPGGGCDADDESVLHAAARELWEEAGLRAAHFEGPVGAPQLFRSSSGKRVCKLHFVVRAETGVEGGGLEVVLDPREHQAFVWATLEEVRARRVGDVVLELTTGETERLVLAAFGEVSQKL